jgi:Tfp pilus assembly protein PilN
MNHVTDLLAFLCVVLGLAALGSGAWILLVVRDRLARHERNQIVLLMLVGAMLCVIGYVLSRPAY